MATPNAELAYRVLDHIDANPEQWRQSVWLDRSSCGTVGCFAGWTTALSGLAIEYSDEGYGRFTTVDGQPLGFRYAAERLLGINDDESGWLFAGSNSRAELEEAVAEIFGPRPEPTA